MPPDNLLASRLVAHRGYQHLYPENSPLAIEKAIECGAQYFEIDVQFSFDGVPLLFHDENLARISGHRGKILQYSWQELQHFTAGEPRRFGSKFEFVKISALSDLVDILSRFQHVQAFVELKEESVREFGASFCLRAINKALEPVLSRCVLISFDYDALLLAKSFGFSRIGPVLRDWESRQSVIDVLHADVMFCDYSLIPDQGELYLENCALAVYEIDDMDTARQLMSRGAQFIETFNVGAML